MVNDVISRLRDAESRTHPPKPFDLDAALRQARGRSRRRRAWQAGAGLVASTAVAVGVTTAWPEGTAPSPRPADTAAPLVDPRERLSLLNEPRGADDDLPAELLRQHPYVGEDLVESTIHFLTESDGARYWAGASEDGFACVLVVIPEPDWDWVQGCGLAGRAGVTLGAHHGDGHFEVRLLPDGYEPDADEPAEWNFLTPNLAVSRD